MNKGVLIGLYLVAVLLLLFVPVFRSDDAYFHARQVSSILETGAPFTYDPLSWGGRNTAFSPLFHYIVALAASFIGIPAAAKIVPVLLLSSSLFFIFLIARRIAPMWAALVGSAAAIPVLMQIVDLSPVTLAIPLMFACTYFLMDIDKKTVHFLVCLALLAFTHAVSLVWLFGLAIYLILMVAENIPQHKGELEAGLFSLFFVIWANLVLFKRYFVKHGFDVVWQNIPLEFLSQYFSRITLFAGIMKVGVLPSLAAAYVFYRFLFKEKNKDMYVIMGMVAAAFIVIWWRLIPLKLGLILVGLFILPLFSYVLERFRRYLLNTRISGFTSLCIVVLVGLFLVTAAVPVTESLQTATLPNDLKVLKWIRLNTPRDAVVAAPVSSGHLVTAVAQRPTVIDTNFLLVDDASERFADINSLFRTSFQIEAVSVLDKYSAEYIYVPSGLHKEIGELEYESGGCFRREYKSGDAYVLYKRSSCRARVR